MCSVKDVVEASADLGTRPGTSAPVRAGSLSMNSVELCNVPLAVADCEIEEAGQYIDVKPQIPEINRPS